jgi:cytochrome o ubiquinol oxidase subunit 2
LYLYLAVVFAVLIRDGQMQLLDPAGLVAGIQSKILWAALAFIAVVGSTIIISFFVVIFRYREGNGKAYKPEWTAGKTLQLLGWGIPSLAILVICVLLWDTAHVVDPYKPISSTTKAVTIQVVALRWKWLFIYPNDHVASVNILEIPVGTPINLELTADAPMNSFWIPRLSGQIYAMTGMVTQLHIEADQAGSYAGSAAEISGDGFSGMDFTVNAVSANDYATWKTTAMYSSQTLDYPAYRKLAEPSSYVAPTYYALADQNLFDAIVMQFMAPGANPSTLQVRGKDLQ